MPLLPQALALLAQAQALLREIDALDTPAQPAPSLPALAGDPSAAPRARLRAKSALPAIQGLSKLRSSVRAESKFLAKLVAEPDSIRPAHVACSNIPHLAAVLAVVRAEQYVSHIFQSFAYSPPDSATRSLSVRVDIVADRGMRWIKVRAMALRNATADFEDDDEDSDQDEDDASQASSAANEEDDGFQRQTADENTDAQALRVLRGKQPLIVRQAVAMMAAAAQNPVFFKPPAVVFRFLSSDDPSDKIISALRSIGAIVELGSATPTPSAPSAISDIPMQQAAGQSHALTADAAAAAASADATAPIGDSGCQEADVSAAQTPVLVHPALTQTLNVDISTLISLVTEICHHLDAIPASVYDTVYLHEQAVNEARGRLLPLLQGIFAGRDLVVTRSAFEKFTKIVARLGGPLEIERSRLLFHSADLAGSPIDPAAPLTGHASELPLDIISRQLARVDQFAFAKMRVIPNDPDERFVAAIKSSTRFGEHNIAIFGTGAKLQITTITANAWVERSLFEFGLQDVGLWVHEPRSLVELRLLKYIAHAPSDGAPPDGAASDLGTPAGDANAA
ncbi:hypothetical protein HK105_202864 [Polyrhizophydium stewartii]|uniref:DUF1308 domain-containing protein n=1 Tax=Polyrhizophydium stewartii TaxID=2732419 RepID=A0ABR4NDM8_9FUNG